MCGASLRRDEGVAELGAQEGAGGVAGDAVVPARDDLAHQVGPGVLDVAGEDEALVVHDRVDPPLQRRADLGHLARGSPRSSLERMHLEALEVDEERVAGRVVLEAGVERNLEQLRPQAHRLAAEDAPHPSSSAAGDDRPKSMRARTSRSRSMPGAISTSSRPSGRSRKTQRSVM
jgi:hypothetical protein